MSRASSQSRELRESLIEWLREAIRTSGKSATEIARKAGISSSTLTRPLNSSDYASTISTDTIAKVARATGYPPPANLGLKFADSGNQFREPDARPYSGPFRAAAPKTGEQTVFMEMQSRVLDLDGYLPGDRIEVSLNERPLPGDVVMAQVVALEHGTAETVFRKYEPPFLTTRSTQPAAGKPILIDPERVTILGIVVSVFRGRKNSAA